MPKSRLMNKNALWYVTVAQYSNCRRREDLMLDLQRGSVEKIMEQNGGGPGVAPTYALDWIGPVRQPHSSADWNALAWQISMHAAKKACTACAGGRGAFQSCTRGPDAEACGTCRLRHRAHLCRVEDEEKDDDLNGLHEAAEAATRAVKTAGENLRVPLPDWNRIPGCTAPRPGVEYVYCRHRDMDSESEKGEWTAGETEEEQFEADSDEGSFPERGYESLKFQPYAVA
ncbi:hypothetical protein KEM56_007416 [Ascosphaera pollenicola]|nr:hypothetical protein KEM56_007416 [Ascosphaera pollenicola]